ncbi:MAG TPA: hypothetical protein VJ476_03945 [Rhizomicrobium sp.]|nr:hypothetical protein [Rhizomicrobium sp.]
MNDTVNDPKMFFYSLMGIAIGIGLMFFYQRLARQTVEMRRAKSPNGKAALEGLLLSPIYNWFVRFLGLIAFLGGTASLCIVLTGHLPFGLGD